MTPAPEPPRLPLRIRVSVHGQLGDGTAIVATAWRTIEPHEADYDQAYIIAAGTHRLYGTPMPYADIGEGGK